MRTIFGIGGNGTEPGSGIVNGYVSNSTIIPSPYAGAPRTAVGRFFNAVTTHPDIAPSAVVTGFVAAQETGEAPGTAGVTSWMRKTRGYIPMPVRVPRKIPALPKFNIKIPAIKIRLPK